MHICLVRISICVSLSVCTVQLLVCESTCVCAQCALYMLVLVHVCVLCVCHCAIPGLSRC